MTEIKFHENGQGYFKDLVEITSEEFATFVAKELTNGGDYKIADWKQNEYRFDIYLVDREHSVHIKVLTFSFLTKCFGMDNVWLNNFDVISSIFNEKVKS